ncbi:hypothetical protein GCM10027020_34810 [Nocardioides salsibiostraticola]
MKWRDAIREATFSGAARWMGRSSVGEIEVLVSQYERMLKASPSGGKKKIGYALAEETRLTVEEWARVIGTIINAPADDLEPTIRRLCQQLILEGPDCDISEPPYGRVVVLEDLLMQVEVAGLNSATGTSTIIEMMDVDDGEALAVKERALEALRIGATVASVSVPLGKYVMWGTFDLVEDDPFSGCERADIPDSLGLDPISPTQIRVAMVYELPLGVVAKYPRIIEAAASMPWNPYFKVSVATDDHGWTDPIPNRQASRRPEVVHRPIGLESVLGSFRTIPPR